MNQSGQELRGRRVLVAGAGMAGLSAARALEARGAEVVVVEARDRVGGRVWTLRRGLRQRQHAEAGADLIDADHQAVLDLAHDLGLTLSPVLKRGFGYCGLDRRGRLRIQSAFRGFKAAWPWLGEEIRDYRLAEQRWDSAIARRLAGQSVAGWLADHGADRWLAEQFTGLRGLFLADPDELALLALVDFLAAGGFGPGRTFRVAEGNDRLATGMARRLRAPVQLETVVRRVRARGARLTLSLERRGRVSELAADYLVLALPASTLREVRLDVPVPAAQRDAIAGLRYGAATRCVVQFSRRFWRKAGRPDAFGSGLAIGAVWDGNEQQAGRAGILSLVAGGGAARALAAIVEAEGAGGVARRLAWLGEPSPVLASRTIRWDQDPWARGGYALLSRRSGPALARLARAAGRPRRVRRRAHERPLAGLRQRRRRERTARGRGNRLDRYHGSGAVSSHLLSDRNAWPRCDTAIFSASLTSPSVRPNGG